MVPQKSAQQKYTQFLSLQIQGRGSEAMAIAKKISAQQLDAKKQKVLQGCLERFSRPHAKPRTSSQPVQRLIGIYETYWHQVLLWPDSKKSAEKMLLKSCLDWLRDTRAVKSKTSSLNTVEKRIEKELGSMGYYCLTGIVSPWRELEIWTQQKMVERKVQIPEGIEKVRVFHMKNYLTKGWMAYATMELRYPGGWANKQGLFCNTHAFRMNSERFLISFLGHEAQHFADMRRFPKLKGADLEYRAKLAELSLAKKTAKPLLKSLISYADSKNKNNPHAYANFRIAQDFCFQVYGHKQIKKMIISSKDFSIKKINTTAKILLSTNTKKLLKLPSAPRP